MMTILDSLQTLGKHVFWACSKLVPSYIGVSDNGNSVTSQAVPYLRDQQKIAELEKILAERDAENAAQAIEITALTTENATLKQNQTL
ncbi:hypothetical protein TL16_g02439 [Triparma laevis f. inornata]|uniref:Uncharacterized protein n=1 Tax=Triparma laevis f. inornata TaxID=1714386 RepID=A0A9W6ZVK8_9STRA|nr:hypothetical protein TL16_g02439 [Triparma laevis f. inornata]